MNALHRHCRFGILSFEDRSALEDLISYFNLIIREADKGLSLVVIYHQRHIEEGNRQLIYTSVYLRNHASAIDDIEKEI